MATHAIPAPAHCGWHPAAPAPATEPAVSLRAVSKVFGTFAAIRNLSLELHPNTLTVVLGENGAGKSTLLRLLAGLAEPTHGNLAVFGASPKRQRGRIAYMSHASMLYDELSARENLDYFATLHRTAGDCGCSASPEMALRAVALDPTLPRAVGQYSQGMRQRASLARVLQADPALLLLDEPFSNLDPGSAAAIVDLLADFVTWPPTDGAPSGRTVILTTHQAHLAEPIAHRILRMERGALVSDTPGPQAAHPQQ